MKKTLILGLAGLSLISSGFCSEDTGGSAFRNFVNNENGNFSQPSFFLSGNPHDKVLRLEQKNSNKKNRKVSAATLQKEMKEDWDKIKGNQDLISKLRNEMTEVAKTINFKKKHVSKKNEENININAQNEDEKNELNQDEISGTGESDFQGLKNIKNENKPNDEFYYPGFPPNIDFPSQNNVINEDQNEDISSFVDSKRGPNVEIPNNQSLRQKGDEYGEENDNGQESQEENINNNNDNEKEENEGEGEGEEYQEVEQYIETENENLNENNNDNDNGDVEQQEGEGDEYGEENDNGQESQEENINNNNDNDEEQNDEQVIEQKEQHQEEGDENDNDNGDVEQQEGEGEEYQEEEGDENDNNDNEKEENEGEGEGEEI